MAPQAHPEYDDATLELLAELEAIRKLVTEHETEVAKLLRRRLAIFRQLRDRQVPVMFKVIGTHAGISEEGVQQALRKAEAKAQPVAQAAAAGG